MGFAGRVAVAAVVLGLAACGGGGGGAASCNPGPTASMSITAAGLSPTNVCVSPGGTVTFTNNDAAKLINPDPPGKMYNTASCPAIAELTPRGTAGASQQATFANTVNCTFHDGDNAAVVFSGTVAVTSVVVTGGGY